MKIRRIVPNIATTSLEASRDFYVGLLGLKVAMDLGFVVTLISESNQTAQLNLLQVDTDGAPSAGAQSSISIEVASVDEIHARAVEQGLEIAYPLTDEPYGIRRFFVLDPSGTTVNVMSHLDSDGNVKPL